MPGAEEALRTNLNQNQNILMLCTTSEKETVLVNYVEEISEGICRELKDHLVLFMSR